MKLFKAILSLLIFTSVAQAQTNFDFIRNDNLATTVQSNNLGNSKAAVDSRGGLFLAYGTARSPLKLDSDPGGVVGDALMGVAGVRNEGPSVLADANLDYIAFGTNRWGGLYVDIDSAHQVQSTTGLLKLEDVPALTGDAGVAVYGLFRSSTAQGAGTAGDYTTFNADADGRVYVNPYGAGMGEWFSSCSSAITGTARTAIKVGVAANRHYITSLSCSNNSAVASPASFTDGAGAQFAAGNVGTLASGGTFNVTFPTPVRGSVNTDISVTMGVTATSTICCANGFISPN